MELCFEDKVCIMMEKKNLHSVASINVSLSKALRSDAGDLLLHSLEDCHKGPW